MAINKGKLLKGEPIEINNDITLYQPTVEEVLDFGESDFWSTFYTMCSSAWDMPSVFAKMGINFMEVDDWTYFRFVSAAMPQKSTSLIFDDIDFSACKEMRRNHDDGTYDVVLYDKERDLIIDESTYKSFIGYVREMICFQHSGKKALDKATAKILIMLDEKDRKRKSNADSSTIFDIIVTLVNTEEFKYNYETVNDITLYQLMKSFIQIQGKKNACALLQGAMSGMCDTSNVNKLDMQWIYSDEKYKPRTRKLINNKTKKA